jgi:DNA polymerase
MLYKYTVKPTPMDLTHKLELYVDAASGTARRISAAVAAAAGQPVLVRTFGQWREAARELLAFEIPPHMVKWIAHEGGGDLISNHAPEPGAAMTLDPAHTHPTLHLPRQLMDMLQCAACCREDDRWPFLYRVIWRWQQGEQEVLSVTDEDGLRLHAMVKSVHREEHDMHANIRFRERPEDEGAPRFVAWCEPAHDVLPQVAQHFVSSMGRISWMIATPDASVLWDGETLHNTGPLLRSAADFDDAGEALWLSYYRQWR